MIQKQKQHNHNRYHCSTRNNFRYNTDRIPTVPSRHIGIITVVLLAVCVALVLSTSVIINAEDVPIVDDNKRNDKVNNDPWVVISNFISSNIIGQSSNKNNDDMYKNENKNSKNSNGNDSDDLFSNIWNNLGLTPKSDDSNNDIQKTETTFDPTKLVFDDIKQQWTQFIQSINIVTNPFQQQVNDYVMNTAQEGEEAEQHKASTTGDRRYTNTRKDNHQYDALTELIESVSSGKNDHDCNKVSIPKMLNVLWNTMQKVQVQLEGTFKDVLDIILPYIHPIKLYYYMLQQEMVHNPVYKRRQHAYYDTVPVETIIQISDGLYLSQLAYAKDCTTIREYMKVFHNNSWMIVNCTTSTQPFQPAHFVAIKRPSLSNNGSDTDLTWNYHSTNNDGTATTTASNPSQWFWDNVRDIFDVTSDNTKNKNNRPIEIILVICGTKDIPDMMSDALLVPMQYNNNTNIMNDTTTTNTTTTSSSNDTENDGWVHGGIYQSAIYIHNTYRELFESILRATNRSQIKLWCIGHSLGGGTAALTSIEFNKPYVYNNNATISSTTSTTTSIDYNVNMRGDVNMNINPNNAAVGSRDAMSSIDAYALGFGTPAVLSKQYSEMARNRVTTIINDADCVPRMSGTTLVNFLINVTISDHWIEEAQTDVQQLKIIMKDKLPFPADWTETILTTFYNWITTSDVVNATVKTMLAQKMIEPVLFPPGECIHLYRDGTSWQGVYYPCTKFDSIEGVRHMIDDHLIPTGYYRGILGFIRAYKNDMNWQFTPDLTNIPV